MLEDLLDSQLIISPDYNQSDIEQLIQRLDNCHQATQMLIQGKISIEDYLDILEFNGHDIDNYFAVTDANLLLVGC